LIAVIHGQDGLTLKIKLGLNTNI